MFGDDDEEGVDCVLSDGDVFVGVCEGEFMNDEIDVL